MTKRLTEKKIRAFQKEILQWYEKNKRDLPWRRTREPYRILVSEVMAQQTQLTRVIPKYEAWLKEFPTIASLANAKTTDVLRLWSGLGYNRRALYLQKAAKALNELRIKNYELWGEQERDEYWPKTPEELKKLPGIGEYTARAVACFAFDQQVAVVDTNIRKVILTRFQNPRSGVKRGHGKSQIPSEKEIQEIAGRLLPKGKAYEWNQALMDYASSELKKEKIPIPKQSRFHGSNRYYRGQIIKLLIQEQRVKRQDLGRRIKPDFSPDDEAWFMTMLTDLEREGFISISPMEISIN